MKLVFLICSILVMVKSQGFLSQCPSNMFRNENGDCQCMEPGKFPQPIDVNLLEETLKNLDMNYYMVTNQIPSVFSFIEGESGYYIRDGGNDMFDGGNILSFNPSQKKVLIYSQGV